MEIVEQQDQAKETPDKIYDLDKGEFVDNPLKKQPKKEEQEEGEGEEGEGEDKDKKPEAKKKDKPTEVKEEEQEEEGEEGQESEEEGEEQEEGEEGEEEEEGESEEDKSKKSKKDEAVTPDAYVAETFGEKYGIKTEKDLQATIDKALDAIDELDGLKKENTTLKSNDGKPKFTTPAHESAYNFVSKFDPNMQGEALQTFAKLITMDLEAGNPTMLLEEKFVHENPQWTRSEAQRMFNKEYAKKYTLNREKFDGTDEEFAQEQSDMEIMKKGDIARAKTYLTDLKSKHKPAEAAQPKVNELVVKAVEKNARDYAAYIEKTNEIVFEDAGQKYNFKLDAEKKKQVSEMVSSWVKNPASYNDKGELLGATSDEEMVHAAVGGLFLKDIIKSITSQVKNVVGKKRIEDVAKVTPKKRPAVGKGESVAGDDLDAQAIRLIKKKQG